MVTGLLPFPCEGERSQRSDSASFLITEVEVGRGVALALPMLKLVAGKRLLYRPLTGTAELAAGGVAPATKGNVLLREKNFAKSCGKHLFQMNNSGRRGY